MHVNVNSLLFKINELRYITRLSNAAVIGVSESKLNKSIPDSATLLNKYNLLHCHRNRKVGGVACYIRIDLIYTQNYLFPYDIENVFFEIHLPKTRPPPNQINFIKTFNENFAKFETTNISI